MMFWGSSNNLITIFNLVEFLNKLIIFEGKSVLVLNNTKLLL